MPKATKARATTRRGPLASKDTNAAKKPSKTKGKVMKEQAKRPEEETEVSPAAAPEEPEKPKESLIENYLLLVRMTCSDDPVITRLLSVPSDLTFAKLHHVLQAAFGWAGCHAYSFSVSKLLEEGQQSFTGRGKEILTLMWDDDMKDAYPDPDQIKKDSDYTLADIYDSDEYKGKIEVSYEYDHGDSWDHEISFLGRADPAMRRAMHIPDDLQVVCLAGEGHPCAEDAGGAGGWEDLKKTFKRRNDPEGRKDWYKYSCANGDPKGLDPYKWDILDVNDALSQIKA